jgi:hypothetical protein
MDRRIMAESAAEVIEKVITFSARWVGACSASLSELILVRCVMSCEFDPPKDKEPARAIGKLRV